MARREAVKGIQFAVLLSRIGLRVLDGITHQQEEETIPGSDGFNRVIAKLLNEL